MSLDRQQTEHRPHVPERRRRRRVLRTAAALATAAAATAALATAVVTVPSSAGAATDPAYTVTDLNFLVHVGPGHATACNVVGDLYLPRGASPTHRVPSILTTNGFGGSAADQTPFAEQEATLGYAVLSYSGLGFGGSDCKITLDNPLYDGEAASQLVSYLGGEPGIAFADASHTEPAPPLDDVIHDARDHDGHRDRYDPRVGMWGGSYGGEIQFAAAAIDPRIDAINPQITWNDLSYSLGPNNATSPGDVTVPDPGATKLTWGLLFSSVGVADGVQYASSDPYRLEGCPNFPTFVCEALLTAGTAGYFLPAYVRDFREASVESYINKIKIPVLLDQGEDDTLFNLNEAVATYDALRRQHTPVDMLWREQGHSGGTPSAAGARYEDDRIQAFFDHYLMGDDVSTGSRFAYYRDWTGTFAQSNSYPVGTQSHLYLAGGSAIGGGSLTPSSTDLASGSQSFTTLPGGPPTTVSSLDAIGSEVPGTLPTLPDENAPGTYASWQTAPLGHATDVVGSPQLTVKLTAPTLAAAAKAGPGGQLVLFAKIYDVAPDGTASLIHGLVAPFRVASVAAPVRVTLPGIVHRFAAGDRIRLVIAGGDTNYRGGLVATPVTVATGSPVQELSLPVVG